ncbi:uncharacterized protein BJ212DRAFT_1480327 [Suillus subaureus]|uniref:Uncharacterized protein n=1 Tax=Suillus subaureus TaxID=48587 RepID=A0A9P7JE59_9AGAM|nr:uncharacterized protein BJ212DRAFT_1480327 [Suillus subaureus]KAG1817090.1 hypothetical protein BJ212DRAFT_1480327 [Suillus subaureus]
MDDDVDLYQLYQMLELAEDDEDEFRRAGKALQSFGTPHPFLVMTPGPLLFLELIIVRPIPQGLWALSFIVSIPPCANQIQEVRLPHEDLREVLYYDWMLELRRHTEVLVVRALQAAIEDGDSHLVVDIVETGDVVPEVCDIVAVFEGDV